MKNIINLGIFATILFFFSCSKENIDNGENITTSEATNEKTTPANEIYKISQLPQLPNFAKPIKEIEEIRKFTLVKDDETKLNFNLKSSKQKLFGKMRTFIGFVNKNKKAIMILGENGFELFFEDLDENDFFHLKSNTKLNIGYKELSLNFDNLTKNKILALAKQEGNDGQTLINNFINRSKRNSASSNKSTQNYTLLNQTSLENEALFKSDGKCTLNFENYKYPNYKKNSHLANQEKVYNIEILYMENDYDFLPSYANLIYSFIKLSESNANSDISSSFSVVPNVSQYVLPLINSHDKEIEASENAQVYYQYMHLLDKVSDADIQTSKLNFYIFKNPNNTGKKIVKCALYKESWNGQIWGSANVGPYFYSMDLIQNPTLQSSLISSDKNTRVFAHECGHNLGAIHDESNREDLMFPKVTASKIKKAEHYNFSNIKIIKESL